MTDINTLPRKIEELKVVIEALQQFIDNQPDVDEGEPPLAVVTVAQRMLDEREEELTGLLWDFAASL